ncbi:MAG: acyltransferase family protein [Synergistaceae bacterium]|nr:acyltransferase family protein [Synergistaceae bacterium]
MRGLAIILVVFYHLITSVRHLNIDFTHSSCVYSFLASFHMPLFFMISGYVHGIKDRYADGKGWLFHAKRDFAGLYIPCMILSLIYFAIKYFLFSGNTMMNDTPTLEELCATPYMGLSLYWFLAALFFIKLLHLMFECRVKSMRVISFFWVILFIMISLFRFCLPEFIARFSYGIYFHAGYVIQRKNLMPCGKHSCSFYGAVMILTGALCFLVPYVRGGADTFTRTAAAMCISLGLFTVFYALGIKTSFLSLCGVYSIMIYALHSYAFVALKFAYKLLGMSSFIHPVASYVMGLLAGVMMPLLVVWVYKNVRCLRWIEYIFYPGKLFLRK